MNGQLYLSLTILFVATLLAGLLTGFRKWSDDFLHLILSFGAGIFLGVVFVHLLPEALHDSAGPNQTISVLLGFLLIFFVERFLFSREAEKNDHKHRVVSYTVLIGLSLHSIVEGIGLAVTSADSRVGPLLYYSILAHKIPAAVALASLLALANLPRRMFVGYLTLFAASAPLGALVVASFWSGADSGMVRSMTGWVTGSFLYIATGDLLPEVFHSRRHRWLHLFLLLAGIVAMIVLGLYLPDVHDQ